MAIRKKDKLAKLEIDLTGPEGSALFLIGTAGVYAKQLDLDGGAIMDEMTNGDYEHLIQVFDKHFGNYVDLVR